MDLLAFPPLAALLDVAADGLAALTALLTPLAGTGAAAVAVVLVTLLVRALLLPAGVAQARAEQTRARLAPRLRALQKRHRQSPERLQRETMQLYRDEGASPFAGCLPLVIQAPLVGLIYAVFAYPMIAGHDNALLRETLLGVPLGTSVAGSLFAGTLDAATAGVFGALIAIIVAVAETSRRMLTPPLPPREPDSPIPAAPAGLLGALQFATAAVALFVPLAAALYLTVTVGWTLAQRLLLRRRYPLP